MLLLMCHSSATAATGSIGIARLEADDVSAWEGMIVNCEGCGVELATQRECIVQLCDLCYAEQRIAAYDERDANDEREQQALDERE
jgi:predicted CxxxxCH...CXXCH cytochrome family protein